MSAKVKKMRGESCKRSLDFDHIDDQVKKGVKVRRTRGSIATAVQITTQTGVTRRLRGKQTNTKVKQITNNVLPDAGKASSSNEMAYERICRKVQENRAAQGRSTKLTVDQTHDDNVKTQGDSANVKQVNKNSNAMKLVSKGGPIKSSNIVNVITETGPARAVEQSASAPPVKVGQPILPSAQDGIVLNVQASDDDFEGGPESDFESDDGDGDKDDSPGRSPSQQETTGHNNGANRPSEG